MSQGSREGKSRSRSGNAQQHYAHNLNAAPLRIISRDNSRSRSRSRSKENVNSVKFEPMYATTKMTDQN